MKRFLIPSFLVLILTLSLSTGAALAETSWDNGLTVTTDAEDFRLNFGALIQPRFEYENRESNNTQHTSFSVQRLRTDLKGHAYTPHLQYRVLVEFAQNPTLLEGWVEYGRFDPFSIRMGQMTVPFNRERDIPVTKLLTTQRSLTNGEFNWPTGRDIGMMLSQERIGGLEYRLGVFGGEGRNAAESSSNGVLTSGRATYEILGEYERSESHYEPAESPNLSLGAGLLYAHNNTARNWSSNLGPGVGPGVDTANILNSTADLQFRHGAWSTEVSYFYREVRDYDGAIADVEGNGFNAQLGYILVPGTLSVHARHARIEPNSDDQSTQQRESTLGLHLFQKEHRSQVRFELGRRENHDGTNWASKDEFIRIQQQLSF